MANEVLHKEWRTRLRAFAKSGKTIIAWCAEHEIPVHQFHYWRRRLSDSSPQQVDATPADNWMAVAIVPEPSVTPTATHAATIGGVAIRIGAATIEVNPGFDATLLRAVVVALGDAPC